MLSRAQNTFHHNRRLRGPVSSTNQIKQVFYFLFIKPCIFFNNFFGVQKLHEQYFIVIPAFFFRKKGNINFMSKLVLRPSVRVCVRPSHFL